SDGSSRGGRRPRRRRTPRSRRACLHSRRRSRGRRARGPLARTLSESPWQGRDYREGMSDLSAHFRITQSLDHGEEPTTAFFFARVLAAEFTELRQEAWPTSERSLDRLGPGLLHSAGQGTESVVVDRDGGLVVGGLNGGYFHVRLATPDAATATSVLEGLRELFPAPEPIARHDVPVAFWT